MRAPVVQIQRKAKAGYQKVLKIREECEMRFTIGMAKVNRWQPESFTKKSSVKLLGGLAVGAMLITATTFTYDQLRRDEGASLSSNTQITEASQASAYWVQRDEAEEMTYDELSKNFIGIPSPGTQITHLENQIASLLADAARDPSRNTPQLSREIERLDNQIDMLRLSAMPDTSRVRPLWNLRSIERLEEQISIIVQNAAQAGKPLSNKEIERLYAQIDLMLAAEAQDRSGYSPSFSE